MKVATFFPFKKGGEQTARRFRCWCAPLALVAGFGAAAFAIAALSAQIDSLRPCSAVDPNRQGAACPLRR